VGRWASQARGGIAKRLDMGLLQRFAIGVEYPNWQERAVDIGRAMIDEILEVDLHDAIRSFEVPGLFVGGALDTIVPESSMRRDYAPYGGPKKFVLLEGTPPSTVIAQPRVASNSFTTYTRCTCQADKKSPWRRQSGAGVRCAGRTSNR
jgi:pimeloyl-ACP methyl ester carboxylesterase